MSPVDQNQQNVPSQQAVEREGQIIALATLIEECARNAEAHGFWDHPFNFGEKIALVHSELSEALEAHRTGRPEDEVIEELADAIIRLFDLAGHNRWNLAGMILHKMEVNRARPFKHGKSY